MFKKIILLTTSLMWSCTLWAASYQLIKKIPVTGDGGWDYLTLDSATRRLYISHTLKVQIMDVDREKIIGEIPNTLGVHGIALAPELNRGFVSNGKEGTVTIFDLTTLKEITRVKAGLNPDAILFDPATKRTFAFNGKSMDVTAIDAKTGNVLGQIPLGAKPEFAATDGQGSLFVNLEDKSVLVHIDPQTLTIKDQWPLAPCVEPSALTIDASTHRLFVGCHNKLMAVVDSTNGHVITTLPIGERVDAAVFDPELKQVFSSNGDGTLTVIQQDSADQYHVLENVKTETGARTVALDTKTHKLYLPDASFGPAPAATADQPHPRPAILAGTFHILVVAK
jgi:DNA-binding beta-propeller fold protein YncE